MNKFRKKGSVIVEYLVVLPVFMLMLWTITQLILYSISSSTAHEAAMYGAEVVAKELRGSEKKITELDATMKANVLAKFHDKASKVVQFNKFLLLYNNTDGSVLSSTDIENMTILENEASCLAAIQDTNVKRVICIYTKGLGTSATNVARDHKQIIVKIKMPFKVIGQFIPGIQDKTVIHASGTHAREISGRYQPYYFD